MKSIFSREQEALISYQSACLTFERMQRANGNEALLSFTTLYSESFGFFGATELIARQSERYDAVGIMADYSAVLAARSASMNQRGLDVLSRAKDSFVKLTMEDEPIWDNPKLKEQLESARNQIVEYIVELEIKASDVKKLDAIVAECFTAAQNGKTALSKYVLAKVDELDRIRRDTDRGNRENIPFWKVIGIAIFIGAWIWGFISCAFFRCTVSSTVAPGVLALIGLALILFC